VGDSDGVGGGITNFFKMKDANQNIEKEKLSFFNKFMEVIGWVQIVFSPVLIASIIAVPLYLATETTERLILSILILLVGLILGIIWANKVAKKYGTISFLSRIHGTPEDDKEEKI
jgi:hypothetical protein